MTYMKVFRRETGARSLYFNQNFGSPLLQIHVDEKISNTCSKLPVIAPLACILSCTPREIARDADSVPVQNPKWTESGWLTGHR